MIRREKKWVSTNMFKSNTLKIWIPPTLLRKRLRVQHPWKTPEKIRPGFPTSSISLRISLLRTSQLQIHIQVCVIHKFSDWINLVVGKVSSAPGSFLAGDLPTVVSASGTDARPNITQRRFSFSSVTTTAPSKQPIEFGRFSTLPIRFDINCRLLSTICSFSARVKYPRATREHPCPSQRREAWKENCFLSRLVKWKSFESHWKCKWWKLIYCCLSFVFVWIYTSSCKILSHLAETLMKIVNVWHQSLLFLRCFLCTV